MGYIQSQPSPHLRTETVIPPSQQLSLWLSRHHTTNIIAHIVVLFVVVGHRENISLPVVKRRVVTPRKYVMEARSVSAGGGVQRKHCWPAWKVGGGAMVGLPAATVWHIPVNTGGNTSPIGHSHTSPPPVAGEWGGVAKRRSVPPEWCVCSRGAALVWGWAAAGAQSSAEQRAAWV